jgi:Na+-driven multidrug efflux pump
MSVQAAAPAPSLPAEIDGRTRTLLEAPLLRTLLKLAAPNAVVMVTQISIPLVEIYFIARVSVDALAGVSEVFPLLSLVGAISQGAVGGGVVSAVARTLGSGQRSEANNLVWCAVVIAISLGVVTSAIVLGLGSVFYAAMGARDLSLAAARTYSNLIFGGAVLIWLFNLLLAVIRGTGNPMVPLIVVCGGALLLLPLLPVLILGFGAIPGFGVVGGAIGILTYYAAGSLTLIAYLWGHWVCSVLRQSPQGCAGGQSGKFCAWAGCRRRSARAQTSRSPSSPASSERMASPRSLVTGRALAWNSCWCRSRTELVDRPGS